MSEPPRPSFENFANLLLLFERGGFIFRIALLTVLLWPAAALVTALFLTPENAQTVVPIVSLSPLAPIVLLLLAMPFTFLVLWQDPATRIGLYWLGGLIGVELSVGVYFSLIPVSNDIRLVPILILVAFAVFFLKAVRILPSLAAIFSFLLIIFTIIFVMGGRAKAWNDLQKFSDDSANRRPVAAPAPVSPPSSALAPATRTPGEASPAPLPQTAAAPDPVPPDPQPQAQPQLQETSQTAQISAPPISQAPPPDQDAEPALFTNESNMPIIEYALMDNYTFDIAPCIEGSREIECDFRITNHAQSDVLQLGLSNGVFYTQLIDDKGQLHRGESLQLGTSVGSHVEKFMPQNTPKLASVKFLLAPLSPHKAQVIEILAPIGLPKGPFDRPRTIRFQNILIQREQ